MDDASRREQLEQLAELVTRQRRNTFDRHAFVLARFASKSSQETTQPLPRL